MSNRLRHLANALGWKTAVSEVVYSRVSVCNLCVEFHGLSLKLTHSIAKQLKSQPGRRTPSAFSFKVTLGYGPPGPTAHIAAHAFPQTHPGPVVHAPSPTTGTPGSWECPLVSALAPLRVGVFGKANHQQALGGILPARRPPRSYPPAACLAPDLLPRHYPVPPLPQRDTDFTALAIESALAGTGLGSAEMYEQDCGMPTMRARRFMY